MYLANVGFPGEFSSAERLARAVREPRVWRCNFVVPPSERTGGRYLGFVRFTWAISRADEGVEGDSRTVHLDGDRYRPCKGQSPS